MAERGTFNKDLHPYLALQNGERVSMDNLRKRNHGLVPHVQSLIASGELLEENGTIVNPKQH